MTITILVLNLMRNGCRFSPFWHIQLFVFSNKILLYFLHKYLNLLAARMMYGLFGGEFQDEEGEEWQQSCMILFSFFFFFFLILFSFSIFSDFLEIFLFNLKVRDKKLDSDRMIKFSVCIESLEGKISWARVQCPEKWANVLHSSLRGEKGGYRVKYWLIVGLEGKHLPLKLDLAVGFSL